MKLNRLVGRLAVLGLAAHAGITLAQSETAAKLERVEVTGSSIKRLVDEGALPLEVITADQIRQKGLSSAEDVLRSLAANAANANNAVSSNSVFGQEGDRLAGGGAYANLRGLGPTGTLVLLNGRRLSNQGTSGGSVDLNAIPLDMIERIEVLKDGASAIYGTDAIGGVINFILKRDYRGVQASANYSSPQDGAGGQQRKLNLTAGWGDMATQGFNISGSITHSRNDILRGVDRPWALGYQPDRGLAPDTSSSPFFGNILGQSGSALPTAGTTIGATDPTKYTVLNALALTNQCTAVPFGVSQLANPTVLSGLGYTKANSTYRCGTDYGRQYMLAAPSKTTSGVVRATFNVGKDATGFVEFVGSRYYSLGEFTPYQFSTTALGLGSVVNGTAYPTGANYPVNGPYYVNMKALYGANQFDPTKSIAYRLRMWDWGYRTLGNESVNDRLTAGIEGAWGNYDYRLSIARGKASGYQEMVDGYADTNKLVALLTSGIYNPFLMPGQTQTAAAMKAVEDTKVHGRLADGRTQVDQVLANISGPLMKLPAGDLSFALGTDLRREFYGYSGTQNYNCVSSFSKGNMLLANSVMGCPGNGSAPDMTRNVGAVYGELLIPALKSLEFDLALRYDHYQEVGSTTNPKVSFKFTPNTDLLLRGSYNTGFRAPTPQQLHLATVTLATTGTFPDPVKCPNPTGNNDPSCQLNSIPYLSGGNAQLKPEKSRQGSLGVVFSPVKDMTASVDYWQIKMIDRIHNLTPTQELQNYSVFANNFIRDPSGNITLIQAGWINAGGSMTKGLDLTGNWAAKLGDNRLTTTLSATKMISAREQLVSGTPMIQYVGQWTNTTLYLPWKGSLSSTYKTPTLSTTLSANYSASYWDEDHTTFTNVPELQRRKVSKYLTFNLIGTFTGVKDLSLGAGIINLFGVQPPFTWHDVDNAVGTGWDPRVADPRGRTLTLTASYKFF
ncbi:TonB-dependent receptor plug domain-containing protein [Roseateles saccharophilus]|uniref:Iron complex outermembrane receptor protein n=1 Tax=Roseateles saccharophilus TaxID=304 RepID=A0A4R3VGA2_ROSSA|nr:TonB-dependent receptor [Roseateles saccharophilus]TCV04477.1 iron complex outermembrane receptor protein [Roseateles saccharophilus]